MSGSNETHTAVSLAQTFSKADAVYETQIKLSIGNSLFDNLQSPFSVVQCSVSGLETLPRRRNIGMSNVREYRDRAVLAVSDNPSTEFVRGTFESESN